MNAIQAERRRPAPLTMGPPGGGMASSGGSLKPRGEASLLAAACVAVAILAGYIFDSIALVWCSLFPALWLAASHPVRLVQLLAITTPTFPIVRLTRDFVGAQQVSTKGLFISGDDPIIAALGVAWLIATLRRSGKMRIWYPNAMLSLLILYPLICVANLARLDTNQSTVSLLYYFKWAEYAILMLALPRILSGQEAVRLATSFPRLMMVALLASALFASYEFAEALRTGSYSQAAAIPRASSFFGTLDPARFGASEDPVNFGTYVVVAGSVALAVMGANQRGGLPGVSFLASLAALLFSASRAPLLAGAVAFGRVQKLGSSRMMLGVLALVLGVTGSVVLAPQLWHASFSRFEALGDWSAASESSATNRLEIALHSPVFDVDQYWLIGHGHSSYRFIAEEHLSRITTGISRSLYNFLLTAWYDAGPAGLLLWMLLFLQLRRKLESVHTKSALPAIRTFAWGLLGALWGLALASMFGEVPYNWRVMGSFYLAVGACLAADEACRTAAPTRFFWLYNSQPGVGQEVRP
jgi:hypothetical protein